MNFLDFLRNFQIFSDISGNFFDFLGMPRICVVGKRALRGCDNLLSLSVTPWQSGILAVVYSGPDDGIWCLTLGCVARGYIVVFQGAVIEKSV